MNTISNTSINRFSDFKHYEGMFGCYAFFDAGVCLYVGKATCIYSRVKSHKSRFESHERFKAWNLSRYIKDMDYANARVFLSLMEAYFITILEPVENVSLPDFYKKMLSSGKTKDAFFAVERITKCFDFLEEE